MAEQIPGAEKKVLAGVLALVFPVFAIHRFMIGDTKGGVIRIIIAVCTCGLGSLISFIEGIIFLTKSDEEFVETYINQQKAWF